MILRDKSAANSVHMSSKYFSMLAYTIFVKTSVNPNSCKHSKMFLTWDNKYPCPPFLNSCRQNVFASLIFSANKIIQLNERNASREHQQRCNMLRTEQGKLLFNLLKKNLFHQRAKENFLSVRHELP